MRLVHDPDFELHVGDALETLTTLPDGSVDCVVTSPPYWGLRDYSTDGQLGLEATPDQYVTNLVAVFREVRRVLADHGSVWLNLGDSYASAWACDRRNVVGNGSLANGKREDRPNRLVGGLKEKDLVGIPWRVAFALQADGWYLRSDIIWSKPNPMPESVTDRPTKAHEYVFLLSKGPRYWFDQEAVREPATYAGKEVTLGPKSLSRGQAAGRGIAASGNGLADSVIVAAGRNVRSVWEIATRPFPEAHFATYPPELVRRCLLAGCPERVCQSCGKPSERIVERGSVVHRPASDNGRGSYPSDSRTLGQPQQNGRLPVTETVGWSDCGHNAWRPGTVLDPFLGSGTTALVAREHGRRCVGIELNPDYAQMAARRLGQLSLLA